MSARSMFGEPMVQGPATTIRILREKLLDAMRREKSALAEMRASGASLSEVADKYLLCVSEVSEALDAESMAAERPAPRFKVGDWVRVVTGPNSAGRTTPILVTCITIAGYIQADGATWASEHLEPASPPAPEVVDVPQPEPWHARLVRLASDVAAATKAHEDAQAEREAAERRESDAWTALRNARGALHDATKVSAILAAQSEPTRPEPRYKAGDWVRVMSVADGGDASCVGVVFRVLSVFVSNGIDIYVSPKHGTWPVEHLTPALDPALHETARRTVAWLESPAWVHHPDIAGTDAPPGMYTLPGYDDWIRDADKRTRNARWAAQLERLLGGAS